MKWKSLMFASVVGIGLTMSSCSDEVTNKIDPTPVGGGEEELGEMAFLSTQIQTGTDISSKAATDTIYEAGTKGEQSIDSIRLVYYKAETMIAKYAFTYKAIGADFKGKDMFNPEDKEWENANFGGFKPGVVDEKIIFMPKSEVMPTGHYKLLVMINPSPEIIKLTLAEKDLDSRKADGSRDTTFNVGTNYANFQTLHIKGNDLSGLFVIKANPASKDESPTSFFMSNQRGLEDVLEEAFSKTEEQSYMYEKRLNVSVDRAVAKVTMQADLKAVGDASNAEVSDASWKLDVTNLSTYYLRKEAQVVRGGSETLNTPRVDLYAEDTNYDNYSWLRYQYFGKTPAGLKTATPEAIKDHFNYIDKSIFDTPNVNKVGDQKDTKDWAAHASEYVLENTMDSAEQYEDVTTAAVLKVKYIPKTSAMGTDMTGASQYFVWEGYVFTAEDLKAIRDFDATTIDPADPKLDYYNKFITLDSLMNKDANKKQLALDFGDDFTNLPAASMTSCGFLEFNADGINYYRLLIRHFNDSQEPITQAYGRYGIVRNNWYRITLTSLLGPGSIDVPTPKGPDDKFKYNIAAQIDVLPWVVRDQSATGGGWY